MLGSLFWTATASMDLAICQEPGETSWGFLVGQQCFELQSDGSVHREDSNRGDCKDIHVLSSDFGDQIHLGQLPALPTSGPSVRQPHQETSHAVEARLFSQAPLKNQVLKRISTVVLRH